VLTAQRPKGIEHIFHFKFLQIVKATMPNPPELTAVGLLIHEGTHDETKTRVPPFSPA
jgi:hypothetical protein